MAFATRFRKKFNKLQFNFQNQIETSAETQVGHGRTEHMPPPLPLFFFPQKGFRMKQSVKPI